MWGWDAFIHVCVCVCVGMCGYVRTHVGDACMRVYIRSCVCACDYEHLKPLNKGN